MGTLTIGRVGLDATLTNPGTWDQAGDQINISGTFRDAGSVAAMKVLRAQLSGHFDNPYEPVIPVTWSTDSTLDGFYRLTGGGVSVPVFGYKNGFATFSVTLERVYSYAAPMVQIVSNGADRSDTPGGVNPVSWQGVPNDSTGYAIASFAGFSGSPATRVGPGGTAKILSDIDTFYDATTGFLLPPGDWYDQSAVIKSGGFVVTGRQMPSGITGWELSNGLLKVAYASATTFYVYPPIAATPSSYGTPYTLTPAGVDTPLPLHAFPLGNYVAVSILRNAPEECCIRLAIPTQTTFSPGMVYFDLSIRRGSRVVTVTITGDSSFSRYGLTHSTTLATALASGGGFRATANDADGNRAVVLGSTSITTDNKTVYASGPLVTMAVGAEVGGSGSSAPDQATDLRDQWFAGTTETQSVVAR